MQRKGPLPGKIFARCIPERRFAGLFGYTARISCQSQLVLDAWRANLAREGRFSRPRPPLGYIERKNCHGLPPGNASRENIATDGRPWTHHGEISPPSDVGGRNSRVSRHRRAPGNAPGHNLATTGRPRRTLHAPRPYGSRSAHGAERSRPCPTRPTLMPPLRPPRHYGTMRRTRRFCRR